MVVSRSCSCKIGLFVVKDFCSLGLRSTLYQPCDMGLIGVFTSTLQLSITFSLVSCLSTSLDAPLNSSTNQTAPIPSQNSHPKISDLKSSSSSSSTLSLYHVTTPADNGTLNAEFVSCTGAPFPRSLSVSYASCRDAFSYINRGEYQVVFGDRASGDWDFILPHRWMSGE